VIADLRMPGMTGTELLGEIRGRFPQTSCAILTGDHALTVIRDGGRAGAAAVLFKPWKDEALRDTVRRLLERPPGAEAP
jgi:DNA-binding NarL/FixJ family response regulator